MPVASSIKIKFSKATVVDNRGSSVDQVPANSWKLAVGHFEGYMAPVIVHPRPSSETAAHARHRNAYPGQPYAVPIVVQGGAWPFYYELLEGPPGASIGNQLLKVGDKLLALDDYGILNIRNPVEGTYSINIRVTDQNNVVKTIAWSLVVGTPAWLALDKNAGVNGSGTLESPYNTEASLEGKSTKCVLVREGTINASAFAAGLNGFPRVWVPYGDEQVNWKVAAIYCNSTTDLWLSDINLVLDTDGADDQQWFLFDTSSRVTFFRNKFNGANLENTNVTPSNSAILFWADQHAALDSPDNSFYTVIYGNEFKDIRDRDLLLGYSQQYKVIEANKIINYQEGVHSLSHGFYEKTNCDHVTHRRNTSLNSTNTAKLIRWDAYEGNFPMDNFEACYNSYRFAGDADFPLTVGYEQTDFGMHRYIYRNTLFSELTGAIGLTNTLNNAGNKVTISNNVLVTPVTTNHGIELDSYNGQFTDTGNISGIPSGNLVDSNNNLVIRKTPNLGTAGAEVK